ncbi:MAG: hypothetical protein L6R45_02690 [Anaerolineae bacterium]|nr:hypothetical protein [Anaerolineae bacterium]
MSNKLIQRFYEIEAEVAVIQETGATNATVEAIQARITALETKQMELKKTMLHLIALSKLRDEAWQTLSYGLKA